MRTLRFIVEGNTIKEDPSCNFSGLFPSENSQVKAEFNFSPEWKSMVKVAAFWSMLGNEYPPRVIKDGKTCIIPTEALRRAAFKVQILGKKNGVPASTNKLTIYQKGGTE